VSELQIDFDLIADVASRLDLREPNKEALESIAAEVSQHYDVEGGDPPFEAVVDSATGVGKTYILAATIEYFAAAKGTRDFAVITPGRTILDKTVDNFTLGHPKSLLGPMAVRPVVITSDNFASPSMRAAMADPDEVKLYVFTVQALTKPGTKTGRRTHKFQEGLGSAFYEHLQGLADLLVFADEHHVYFGPAFSRAIRDLAPRVLIGLTATPHKKTPDEQIIYRYPLAAAIADQLVKTPVLVGRKDDRTDPVTKLQDGAELLRLKAEALASYCTDYGVEPVNPVMLVIAQTIEDAEAYGAIIRSSEFQSGRFADAVLVVHSVAPDQALAALATVEDQASPVRIILSVGMLKEGWDVRNVYVIASMRASISDILTEQTLGRGLRLPFRQYTGIEILDTLEVLAHERYEDLLRRAGVIIEAFIDYRSRAVLRRNARGDAVSVIERTDVTSPVRVSDAGGEEHVVIAGSVVLDSVEDRTRMANEAVVGMKVPLTPLEGMPLIHVPRLVMTTIESHFSLADITDLDAFRQLGRRLAADPATELRRTRVGARVVVGPDGFKRTELVTSTAADKVVSKGRLLPLQELVSHVTEAILAAPVVPARKDQRPAARPIVDAFIEGLGDKAAEILSGHLDRATARLVRLVTDEQRRFAAKPRFSEVVEVGRFAPPRTGRTTTSQDLTGRFSRSVGYEGWRRSLYRQAWFDSEDERSIANLLDSAEEIRCWVRLHTGDLPILWGGAGGWYNPDFLVVEVDGTHWVVEVKMDKEMASADVAAKREAAERWANHVSADSAVSATWRYLLASQADIRTVKGSWPALKRIASS
jgi:type III restriction enzyme